MTISFTSPLAPLRRAVERVAKIVERRNTIPILSNIGIRAERDGRITITGTDLDIWASAPLPIGTAEVTAPGETTVPATLFLDILKKASADIAFTQDDGLRATIKTGRSKFQIQTLPRCDLPDMPAMEAAASLALTPAQLTRIDDACAFAISTQETRYYLNGIYMHQAEAGLTAVATDGHRLSRLVMPGIAVEGTFPGIIVPRKTIGLFDTIAASAGEGESIAIEATDTRISFETEGLRIVSKLIDGTFPDYGRVIPNQSAPGQSIATVDAASLAAAVDRVSAISAERGRSVAFTFDGTTSLALTCRSPDAGEARDELPAEGAFDELAIGFNAAYVLKIIESFPAPATLRIALTDPGSPAVITSPTDDTRLVVLMPMRV